MVKEPLFNEIANLNSQNELMQRELERYYMLHREMQCDVMKPDIEMLKFNNFKHGSKSTRNNFFSSKMNQSPMNNQFQTGKGSISSSPQGEKTDNRISQMIIDEPDEDPPLSAQYQRKQSTSPHNREPEQHMSDSNLGIRNHAISANHKIFKTVGMSDQSFQHKNWNSQNKLVSPQNAKGPVTREAMRPNVLKSSPMIKVNRHETDTQEASLFAKVRHEGFKSSIGRNRNLDTQSMSTNQIFSKRGSVNMISRKNKSQVMRDKNLTYNAHSSELRRRNQSKIQVKDLLNTLSRDIIIGTAGVTPEATSLNRQMDEDHYRPKTSQYGIAARRFTGDQPGNKLLELKRFNKEMGI